MGAISYLVLICGLNLVLGLCLTRRSTVRNRDLLW